MSIKKLSAIFAVALIASAQFSVQAQTAGAGAGAGAATLGAKGAITQNMVVGAVVGVAVIASLNSGSSGAVASPTNQASTSAVTAATAALTQSAITVNAANSFSQLLAGSSINTSGLTTAITDSQKANQAALVAASDLAVATRTVAAVTNNGKVICAASVCTNAEILGLSLKAASTAKVAAEAALYVATTMEAIKTLAASSNLTSDVVTQLTALTETARVASLASQTAANLAIQAYQAVAAATGTTGTTITASTGTTGTIGATGTN